MTLEEDLVQASRDKDLGKIEELLELGTDPNYLSKAGLSALHFAAGVESPVGLELASLLLQYGANPNLKTSEGFTSIHLAVLWNRIDTLKLLLAAGGDPTVLDDERLSAIDYATDNDDGEALRLLLSNEFLNGVSDVDGENVHNKTSQNYSILERTVTFPSLQGLRNLTVNDDLEETLVWMPPASQQRLSKLMSKSRSESTHFKPIKPAGSMVNASQFQGSCQLAESSNIVNDIIQSLDNDAIRYQDQASSPWNSFGSASTEYLECSFVREADKSMDCKEKEVFQTPPVLKEKKKSLRFNSHKSPNLRSSPMNSFISLNSPGIEQLERSCISEISACSIYMTPVGPDGRMNEISDCSVNLNGTVTENANGNPKTDDYDRRKRSTSAFNTKSTEHEIWSKDNKNNGYSETAEVSKDLNEVLNSTWLTTMSEVDENLRPEADGKGAISLKSTTINAVKTHVSEGEQPYQASSSDLPDHYTHPDGQDETDFKGGKYKNVVERDSNFILRPEMQNFQSKINPSLSSRGMPKVEEPQSETTALSIYDSSQPTVANDFHCRCHGSAVRFRRSPSGYSADISESGSTSGSSSESSCSSPENKTVKFSSALSNDTFKTTLSDKDKFKLESESSAASGSPQKSMLQKRKSPMAITFPRFKGKWIPRNPFAPKKQDVTKAFKKPFTPKKQVVKDLLQQNSQNVCTCKKMPEKSAKGAWLGQYKCACDACQSKSLTNSRLPSKDTNQRCVSCVLNESLFSDVSIFYDWKDTSCLDATDKDNTVTIPDEMLKMTNVELKDRLIRNGETPGPINDLTRNIYLKHLARLELTDCKRNPASLFNDYQPEMRALLEGATDHVDFLSLEAEMCKEFKNPEKHRWREGTQKASFNYLLMDPRVTLNLPERASNLTNLEVMRCFISSVFYIGKAKNSRPYEHLHDAVKCLKAGEKVPKVSDKIKMIWNIWDAGFGVVSLHVFHNTIPVEAYTREACMVEAMGLQRLTNLKRGEYYGPAAGWSAKKKRQLGVHLIRKALKIFLIEGEQQIKEDDLKK